MSLVKVELANAGNLASHQAMLPQYQQNSALRHEEWVRFDELVTEAATIKINAVDDILNAGLSVDIGGIGTTTSKIERSGEVIAATANMDPEVKTEDDSVQFDEISFPVPLFVSDFSLNPRLLASSQNRGESLDTTNIKLHTKAIKDKMESMIFNGLPEIQFGGNTVYGYTSHPDRIPATLTESWVDADGLVILSDIVAMIKLAKAKFQYGPFVLYLPCDVFTHFDEDYSTVKGQNTIRERVMALSGIADIKEGFLLPDGEVVLVQLVSETLDIAVAQDLITIEKNPNMHPLAGGRSAFRLIASSVLRLKPDYNDSLGVVHGKVA